MILLVDDDALIGRLIQPHLERAGFQVLLADNGVQAVELAVKNAPELIILDIVMPKMDGLALLRQLKSSQITKSTPVLIASGSYDDLVQKEAKKWGASGYLTKPFSPAQLLAAIQGVMGRR